MYLTRNQAYRKVPWVRIHLSAKTGLRRLMKSPVPLKAPLAGLFCFSAVRAAYCKPKWLEAIATGRNPWDIIAGLRQNRGRKMKAVHIKALVVCVLAFALPGAYAKDPSKILLHCPASSEEAERQLLNVRELAGNAIVVAASSGGFCAGVGKKLPGQRPRRRDGTAGSPAFGSRWIRQCSQPSLNAC